MQKTTVKNEVNIEEFKENVDDWIKQIRAEFSQFKHIPQVVDEGLDNIQHNYELVRDIQKEVDDLKQEVKLLKAMQFAFLKRVRQ